MRYIHLMIGICLICFLSCSDSPKKTIKKRPRINQPETEKVDEISDVVEPKAPLKEPIPKEQLAQAKEMIATISETEIASVDAKAKFKMYCARCHGFNGRLKVNGAADLHKSTIPLEERVAQIYFGRKLMTPFKGVLTDAEIVTLAKYIEKFR